MADKAAVTGVVMLSADSLTPRPDAPLILRPRVLILKAADGGPPSMIAALGN